MIFGGLVVAAMLDGGVRLLGRVLPIGRGWRLLIVVLAVVLFVVGTFYLAGVQITAQVAQLQATLQVQYARAVAWLGGHGFTPPGTSDINGLVRQAAGQLGKVTTWVGTAIGALTYKSIASILANGLNRAIAPAEAVPVMLHPNLRGPRYFH